MKNKNAFTLIELLAVIIILAIVALIATPMVLNVIEDAKKSAGQSEANMIMNGIINYCETEKMGIGVKELICNNGITQEEVNQMVNLGKAEVLEIEYGDKLTWLKVRSNGHIYGLENGKMVRDLETKPIIKPNAPNLLGKLTPIYYDTDGQWKKADVNTKWYDYDNKKWANAVVLKDGITKSNHEVINVDSTDENVNEIDLWYVWIPRYKYQIFNDGTKAITEQSINISFEQGTTSSGDIICTDSIQGTGSAKSEDCVRKDNSNETVKVGDWYTHPAFTFGGKELEGIWVGKFESSAHTSNAEKIAIKPNAISLTNKNVSQFHAMIRKMETDYSISGDTHMMKNMEWGAVAYLAQSNYGLCINNVCVDIERNNYYDEANIILKTGYAAVNKATSGYADVSSPENEFGTTEEITRPYNTDVGVKASTTQNIYGIYDMSGGAQEYTMSNMVNVDGGFNSGKSGFTNELDGENSKYYDKYSYNANFLDFTRGKLGDATKETIKELENDVGGWTGDYMNFPKESDQWFKRGGGYFGGTEAGLFAISRNGGKAYLGNAARGILVAR